MSGIEQCFCSIPEAENYFPKDYWAVCKPTAFAKKRCEWRIDGNCNWWLRTPGNQQNTAAYVGSDGAVRKYGADVRGGVTAVRPALWLNV